ncbi:efflux RND transporter periplasmic adaptor subunit [Bacillus sp. FJAT-29814]|uniref:efflux RND transporter periplasmic adaptor subunit n=1 Tax=Bacillus sp. FJAT-29814 TaxID=1729688 RepID=UPI00082B1441|nr:efflux RND transporter periplasmic adaptor subunit [Bacillus sp. FJAT-29814]
MKKKTWIIIGVASLLVLMISISVYRQAFAKGPAVKTAQLVEEEISSLLMVPGTVKLEAEQLVYASPEKGELQELLVEEGQTIEKDTVIAKLQNPQLELEVEQNKIAIETANLKISQLDKQTKQFKDKEKTLIDQVGKDEAKKQLDPEFERIEMEKKLANLDLKQANLQKDIISKRKSDLEIKSTIDGVVLTAKKPPVSMAAGAGAEPIIHIGKLDSMTASGLLSEYDTLKVAGGQKVIIRSDAVPNQEWQGEITKIAVLPQTSQAGMANGSQAVQYPVTVKITGDLKALKPGFQVLMEIETEKKMAAVLPIEAIHDDGDDPYVFLVKDGKAKKQQVKTGLTSGEKLEIVKGVSKKDRIIVKGPDKLRDGMEVTTQ